MTSHEERIPQLPRLADLERPTDQRRYGTDNYRDVVRSWLQDLTIPDVPRDELAAIVSSVSPDSEALAEDGPQPDQRGGRGLGSTNSHSSETSSTDLGRRQARMQRDNTDNSNNVNHAARVERTEKPAAVPLQKLSISLAPRVDKLDHLLPELSPMKEPASSSGKQKESAQGVVESSGNNLNANNNNAAGKTQARDQQHAAEERAASPGVVIGTELAENLATFAVLPTVTGSAQQTPSSQATPLAIRRETTTEFSDAIDDAHASMQVHGSPSIAALAPQLTGSFPSAACGQITSPVVVFSKPPVNHSLFNRLSQRTSLVENAQTKEEVLPALVRDTAKGNGPSSGPSVLPDIKVLGVRKTEAAAAVVEEVAAAVRNSVTELVQRSSFASQPELNSLPRLDTSNKAGSNGHAGTLSRSHTSGENDPSQSTVIVGLAPLSEKPVRGKGRSRPEKKRGDKPDNRSLREKLQLIEDCEETDRQMIEVSFNTRTRQLVLDARKQTIVVVEHEHRERVESKCDEALSLIKRRFMRKFKSRSITERKEKETIVTKHSTPVSETAGQIKDPTQTGQKESIHASQNGSTVPAPAQGKAATTTKDTRGEVTARPQEKSKSVQREAASKPVVFPQFTATPPSNLGAKAPWLPASLVASWNALQNQIIVTQEDCNTYSDLLFSDAACELIIHGSAEEGGAAGVAGSTATTQGDSNKPADAVLVARDNLLSLIRSVSPEVQFGTPSSPTMSDALNSNSKIFGGEETIAANMEQDYQRRATPSIFPDSLKPVFLQAPRPSIPSSDAPEKKGDDLLWSLAQLRNQRARNGGGLGTSSDANNAEERRRRWRSRADKQNGGFGNKDQKCDALQELLRPRSWKQFIWDSSEVLQERLPFLPVRTVFDTPIAAVEPLKDDVFAAIYVLWRRCKESATSESEGKTATTKEDHQVNVLETPRFLLHHLDPAFLGATKSVGAFLQHVVPNLAMEGIAARVFSAEEGKEPTVENAHATVTDSVAARLAPTASTLTAAELEGLMCDRLVELATLVERSLLLPFLPPRIQANPELCETALGGYRLTDLNIREATWFHQYLEQNSSRWYKSMYEGSPASPVGYSFPFALQRKELREVDRTSANGQEDDQSTDELSATLLQLFALSRRDVMNADVRKRYPFLCPGYVPDSICSAFASHSLRGVPLEALKVWDDKAFIKLAKRLYEAEVLCAKPGGNCSRYYVNVQPSQHGSLETQSDNATAQEIANNLILRCQQDVVRHMSAKGRSIRSFVLVKHFGEASISALNVLLRHYLPDASEVERNRVGSVTKSVIELHNTGEDGQGNLNVQSVQEGVRYALPGNPESSSTILSSHNSAGGATGLLLAAIEPFIIANRSYCSLLSSDASRKPLPPVTLAACVTTFFSSNQALYLENSFPFMKDLDLNRDLTVDDLYPLQNASIAPYFQQYVVERQKLLTMEWSGDAANQLKAELIALAEKIMDAIRVSTVYLINTPARARSCSARSRSIPSLSPQALTLTSAAAAAATIATSREEPAVTASDTTGKQEMPTKPADSAEVPTASLNKIDAAPPSESHPQAQQPQQEKERLTETSEDAKVMQQGRNVVPAAEGELGTSTRSGEGSQQGNLRNVSPHSNGAVRGRPPKTAPKAPTTNHHLVNVPRKPTTRAVKGTHDACASPTPPDTPRSPQEMKNSTDTLPSSSNQRLLPHTRPQNHSNESPARNGGALSRSMSPSNQPPTSVPHPVAGVRQSAQSFPYAASKGKVASPIPRNVSPQRPGDSAMSMPETERQPQIRSYTTQEKEQNPNNTMNAWLTGRGKDGTTGLSLSRSTTPTLEQNRQYASRRGPNVPQPPSPLGENTALVFYKDNGVDVHETVMLGNQTLPSEVFPPFSLMQDTFMEELPSAIASERSGTRSTASNDVLGTAMQYPNASRNSMPASIARSTASGTKQGLLASMQVPQPETSILVKSARGNSPPSPQHNNSADAPTVPQRPTNFLRTIPKQPALPEQPVQPLMSSIPIHAFATQLQSRGVTPMQALRLGSARPNRRAPPTGSHLPQGPEASSFRSNARQAFDPPTI